MPTPWRSLLVVSLLAAPTAARAVTLPPAIYQGHGSNSNANGSLSSPGTAANG